MFELVLWRQGVAHCPGLWRCDGNVDSHVSGTGGQLDWLSANCNGSSQRARQGHQGRARAEMGCCCSVSSGGSGGVSKGREEGKLLEGGRGNTPTYDIPGGAVKSAGGSAGVGNRSDAPTFGAGYRLLDKIGKGSSSECYRCVDRT